MDGPASHTVLCQAFLCYALSLRDAANGQAWPRAGHLQDGGRIPAISRLSAAFNRNGWSHLRVDANVAARAAARHNGDLWSSGVGSRLWDVIYEIFYWTFFSSTTRNFLRQFSPMFMKIVNEKNTVLPFKQRMVHIIQRGFLMHVTSSLFLPFMNKDFKEHVSNSISTFFLDLSSFLCRFSLTMVGIWVNYATWLGLIVCPRNMAARRLMY